MWLALLLFGVKTVSWPRAAKKSGNWRWEIVDASNRIMTRLHRIKEKKSWQHLTAADAKKEQHPRET